MFRAISFFLAMLFGLAATGCTFEHAAAVDYEHMPKQKDGFTVVGYVHAETWTPAILYVFPIIPGQNAEKARQRAFAKAQAAFNADGIADLRLHTESHGIWWTLFIFGWVENHASATAIGS